MSDGTGVPNGGGAGNSGAGVNNNGNGSSNNSSATASYVAPAGEPKIPDGSKGFPLGYSCGRGRTVKLYKILLGKSPLLGSNDETATSNGPENGGALQRGDDSAGVYEDAQAEHYTRRSGTAPSSGTAEGSATMMVNGSDGGGHGSDSEDDIKRLATAYWALDSVLGLNQQQRRQFEEQSNEFDIILRRFEDARDKLKLEKEKLKAGWATERAEVKRIKEMLRTKNKRHHEEQERLVGEIRALQQINRQLREVCERHSVALPSSLLADPNIVLPDPSHEMPGPQSLDREFVAAPLDETNTLRAGNPAAANGISVPVTSLFHGCPAPTISAESSLSGDSVRKMPKMHSAADIEAMMARQQEHEDEQEESGDSFGGGAPNTTISGGEAFNFARFASVMEQAPMMMGPGPRFQDQSASQPVMHASGLPSMPPPPLPHVPAAQYVSASDIEQRMLMMGSTSPAAQQPRPPQPLPPRQEQPLASHTHALQMFPLDSLNGVGAQFNSRQLEGLLPTPPLVPERIPSKGSSSVVHDRGGGDDDDEEEEEDEVILWKPTK